MSFMHTRLVASRVPDMQWTYIVFVRNYIRDIRPPFEKTQKAWLYPDGDVMHNRVWVDVPVKRGARKAFTVDDMETEMWMDCGRGAGDPVSDFTDYSVHVTRFPTTSPVDLRYTYSIVVASQRTSGGLVHAVNDYITNLVPGLDSPWRGNVLVFKHGVRDGHPIINITESSGELVDAILLHGSQTGLVLPEGEGYGLHMQQHALPVTPSMPALVNTIPLRNTRAAAEHRFWATEDVVLYTLRYLALLDLMRFCQTTESLTSIGKTLLKGRITRFTSPFFDASAHSQELDQFFGALQRSKSWIVGSVSLAVASVLSDPPLRDNLNIIAPYHYETEWIEFMVRVCGFVMVSKVNCHGAYANEGKSILRFEHAERSGLSVTVTTSVTRDVLNLFFSAPTTPQQVAIAAHHVITPYPDMTSRQEGLKGWKPNLTLAPDIYVEIDETYKTQSPFPASVVLHDSTEHWDRPCEEACPAIKRSMFGLNRFGTWSWGGIDGVDAHQDHNLRILGKSRVNTTLRKRSRPPHPIALNKRRACSHVRVLSSRSNISPLSVPVLPTPIAMTYSLPPSLTSEEIDYTGRLPVETLGEIISAAAPTTSPWHTLVDFRVDMVLVNDHWKNAAYGQRDLWRWLKVERYTPPRFLKLCLDRIKAGDIVLELDTCKCDTVLDGLNLRRVKSVSMDVFQTTVLLPLAIFMPQVTALMIETDDEQEWQVVMSVLSARPSRSLRRASVIVHYPTALEAVDAQPIFVNCAALRRLSVRAVNPWPFLPSTCTNLTHLKLQRLEGRLRIEWVELSPVLQGAQGLECLTLHDVDCHGLEESPSVALRALVEFDISYSSDSNARLVGLLEMPQVRVVRVEVFGDATLRAMTDVKREQFAAGEEAGAAHADFSSRGRRHIRRRGTRRPYGGKRSSAVHHVNRLHRVGEARREA
ncbi:hypothetical protein DFH09DRAFT_1067899 [Mycena vulgaris]|nr:hypothetical protein DFH09DRAFT_1067899 [Mycena vulgaris]